MAEDSETEEKKSLPKVSAGPGMAIILATNKLSKYDLASAYFAAGSTGSVIQTLADGTEVMITTENGVITINKAPVKK